MMCMKSIRSGVLPVLLAPLAAASVIYSDGTFTPGTWGIEITQANAGGTATAVQSAATGNPGAAFRVQSTVNAASGGLRRCGRCTDTEPLWRPGMSRRRRGPSAR